MHMAIIDFTLLYSVDAVGTDCRNLHTSSVLCIRAAIHFYIPYIGVSFDGRNFRDFHGLNHNCKVSLLSKRLKDT